MKRKRAFAVCLSVLGLLIVLGGCSDQRDRNASNLGLYLPKADEYFYGTWLPSNPTPGGHEKFINYHWGYIEVYKYAGDKLPDARGTYAIVSKQTDKEGNTWYLTVDRYNANTPGVFRYTLTRISDNGNKYEEISDPLQIPRESELKSTNPTYEVWHRSN